MATGSDQAVGWSLVCVAVAIISYYTVWVIVLPFVDFDQGLHQFFPDRVYAIALPLLLGVIGLAVIGLYVTIILMTAKKKEKKS